jgi:hypothetical protein
MDKVYIVAIVATAIVVMAVAFLLKDRITDGVVDFSRKKLRLGVKAKAGSATPATPSPPPLQPGRTVIDDNELRGSQMEAPQDADFKARSNVLVDSSIKIHPGKGEADN